MNNYEKTIVRNQCFSFPIGWVRSLYMDGVEYYSAELCLSPDTQILSWPDFRGPVKTGNVDTLSKRDWVLPSWKPVEKLYSQDVIGYLLASENCDLVVIDMMRRNLKGYCDMAKALPLLEAISKLCPEVADDLEQHGYNTLTALGKALNDSIISMGFTRKLVPYALRLRKEDLQIKNRWRGLIADEKSELKFIEEAESFLKLKEENND